MAPTILLVEDDGDLRGWIQAVLTREGFRVVTASDGEEALQALVASAEAPELVLAEVALRRRSGLELVRAMQEDPRLASIPVVLMAGGPGHPMIERWSGLEDVDVLPRDTVLNYLHELAGLDRIEGHDGFAGHDGHD